MWTAYNDVFVEGFISSWMLELIQIGRWRGYGTGSNWSKTVRLAGQHHWLHQKPYLHLMLTSISVFRRDASMFTPVSNVSQMISDEHWILKTQSALVDWQASRWFTKSRFKRDSTCFRPHSHLSFMYCSNDHLRSNHLRLILTPGVNKVKESLNIHRCPRGEHVASVYSIKEPIINVHSAMSFYFSIFFMGFAWFETNYVA